MSKQLIKDEIYRSLKAPAFVGTLKTSKGQLAIEKFLQVRNFDLQEYIREGKVLDIYIPTRELQELWGDKKNLKRDISSLCDTLMNAKFEELKPNGNFLKMRLVSIAKLTDEGLRLQFVPEALQLYLIEKNTHDYPTLDCCAVSYFKCCFSPHLYWLLRQHRGRQRCLSFTLTPEEVNEQWGIDYTPANLQIKVLAPASKELSELYKAGIVDVRCNLIANRKGKGQGGGKIESWTFNVVTTQLEEMIAGERHEWIKAIDDLLAKELPTKRMYIYEQISAASFPHEKLFKLFIRFQKLSNGELKGVKTPSKYICSILLSSDFRINPNASTPLPEAKTLKTVQPKKPTIAPQDLPSPGLFDDIESVTESQWLESVRLLKETFDKRQDGIKKNDVTKDLNVYDIYLSSLVPVSLKNNILDLNVPSVFLRDVIIDRYGSQVENIIQYVFGSSVKIRITAPTL